MTHSEAVALLERHREAWPGWMAGAIPTGAALWIRPVNGDWVRIRLESLSVRPRQKGRLARVRDGLSDEENVRRILAAAEKGYRQRLRQAEKQARRDRKAKRFEEGFGGKDCVTFGWMRPCDVCGRKATARSPNQNHHEPSRGAGGKAADQVTLCPGCHGEVHTFGKRTFEQVAGVDLRALAAKRYREWLDLGGHELASGLEEHGETR